MSHVTMSLASAAAAIQSGSFRLAAGLGAYHFREVHKSSLAAYKRPVTNIIAPAVDNEVARLTKKEYVPEAAASPPTDSIHCRP
jgi:hypothetical protein